MRVHPTHLPAMLEAGFTLKEGQAMPPERFPPGWETLFPNRKELQVYLTLCAEERVELANPKGLNSVQSHSLHTRVLWECLSRKAVVRKYVTLSPNGVGLLYR